MTTERAAPFDWAAAVAAAELELSEAREEQLRVTSRVAALEKALDGMKVLAGPRPESPAELQRRREERRARIEAAAEQVDLGDANDGPGGRSTTEQVIRILDELRRPLTINELFDEFQQRGWVEPAWKVPEAAVRQASIRARRSGRVLRMPDGRIAAADVVPVASAAGELQLSAEEQ